MNLLDNKRVMVVEDTTIAATYLARELTNLGADVVGLARSEDQAVAMAAELTPELIMMDIHLAGGGSGINAAKKISEQHRIPLVYTTSFSDDATLERALETAPYGYIVKPFDAKAIKVCCETALKRFALEQSMRGTEERLKLGAVVDERKKPRMQKKWQLSNVIVEHLAEGVAIVDEKYRILAANAAFMGFLDQEYPLTEQTRLQDTKVGKILFASFIMQDPPVFQRQKVPLNLADGTRLDAFVTLSSVPLADSHEQFVVTISNFTGLHRTEQKLDEMAFTDPLTGVGNRNYLKFILDESLFTSAIQALLFLDLDGFKQVNDTYGHDVGDELLKLCAKRVKSIIRDNDTLIRHGGDEFIVLMPTSGDAQLLAERILNVVNKPANCKNTLLSVSASIGIAETAFGSEAEQLLRHADVAMYEAKKQGKNTIVTYSPEYNAPVEYRLFMEQGLYDGISKKELYACFQSIVDAKGDICGLEALCRWRGENVIDIAPEIFIPVAEEAGLINALGLQMLREVCIARSLLVEKGHNHIKLHINVSLLQLTTSSLVQQFVTYLADFNIPPAALVIEVKAQSFSDPAAKRVVKALVDNGFEVVLGNFGLDNMDVSMLVDDLVSMVKFDARISDFCDNEKTKILLEPLVDLCKKLGKTVIFSGVETQAQEGIAKALGCDYLQGFLFGSPKSLSESLRIVGDDR